jgi:exopolysaccharide biosynthesis predicted pyruvyltransferase EpsI
MYDYMNCCDRIPQIEVIEKYLILYAYAGRISNEEADWIAKYAKKKNLKVYAIGGIQKCADRFVDCSPFEVLAYFRNAEEVITDTFHGSIFSVITHRPFTTLIRKSVGNSYGNEEKLSDLLNRLVLTERMTTKVEDTERINQQPIDYKKVDDVLQKQREIAKKYLQNNIEG